MPESGIVAWVFGKFLHGFYHVEQAKLICVQHRATAEQWEAIPSEVNHVNVTGFAGNAFFQNMRRFIDQPSLQSSMGKRSRQMAEDKYDVHKVNVVMLAGMGVK